MKLIVIGGVAAGMSAASKLKRVNQDAEIVVYEKGNYLSYGACGLPYFVSGENADYKKMVMRTREQFEQMGMKINTRHEVVKVDPEKKQVMIKCLTEGTLFLDSYDKLVIATGATPIRPPFEGMNLKNIFVLKTIEDGISIKEAVEHQSVKNVVVVGAGYIGIEVVEAMVHRGKNVRLIELGKRILTPFDSEITDLAEAHLKDKGVAFNLGERVERFHGTETVTAVQTDQGVYEADLVVLAVGVTPATAFLKETGINLAANNAIIIDREMRTNLKDIYAAGDCAQVYHKVMEENAYLPLGTTANKCGRILGGNLNGARQKYVGTLGSAAIKVCDLELGRTGLSEDEAKKQAIDYTTVFVETKDHPPYYPNATPIWIKLLCEKGTKRILGAQTIGNKGAVLRVDIFAVAIHNNMTAPELGMTDLVYAPPFAGVWDAVHIASNAVK